jgi:hypothetical protein
MLLLFGLLRSGQIKLRALVGYHEMGKVGGARKSSFFSVPQGRRLRH